MKEETTSIRIKISTRNRLYEIGSMEDTFDSLINRLIDNYKATKAEEEDLNV